MKISVTVKPNARKNEVIELASNEYRVSVMAPAIDGRANEKMIELLSEYMGKPRRAFTILVGKSFKKKVVEIE